MPGVIFKTPFKRLSPFLFFGRLISILIFTFILCAGWVVLSYVKNGVVPRKTALSSTVNPPETPSSSSLPVRANALAATADSQAAAKQPRLVYSSSEDKVYYHSLKHLSNYLTRVALSEDAAQERGLKPCSCISE
jgi:hypothetical protein